MGVQRKQQLIALPALLLAGFLLGVTTNLAKVAHGLGVMPLTYLIWSLMGAALLLLTLSLLKRESVPINRRMIEYYLVAGLLTTAGANIIFFNAVPTLGVSFVAVLMALPPLFTYVVALLMGMERFSWWRMAGVLLALAGTVVLGAARWQAPDANVLLILRTLLGPILLTLGNIYRSWRWPPGAKADTLVPGMVLAGAVLLLLYGLLVGEEVAEFPPGAKVLAVVALQAVIFAAQFQVMLVLQKSGGPVFLSLMGGVSAVFGVPIAVLLLGEHALPGFVVSAALVAAGIASQLMGWRTGAKVS
jgi:drug/metabolite transporter (DMT)-like permease